MRIIAVILALAAAGAVVLAERPSLLPYATNQITPANLYTLQQKVQWTGPRKIQVLRTDHFDVYMGSTEERLAARIADIAEDWYPRLEARMNVRYDSLDGRSERIPLIGYTSATRFQTTNTSPGIVGEGVQGFFDLIRGRIVIPFTGSNEMLGHVIRHEMVHSFTLPLLETSWKRYKADREIVTSRRQTWQDLVYLAHRFTAAAPDGVFPRFVKGTLSPEEDEVGLPPPSFGPGRLHPRIFFGFEEGGGRRRRARITVRLSSPLEAASLASLAPGEIERLARALAAAGGGRSSARVMTREAPWSVLSETNTLFDEAVPAGREANHLHRLFAEAARFEADDPGSHEGPSRRSRLDLLVLPGVDPDRLPEAYRRIAPLYDALSAVPYGGPVAEEDRRPSAERFGAAERALFRYVPPDLKTRSFPLGVLEGVAEFYAADWSDLNDLVLRDLVHEGRLIPFQDLGPWHGYLVYVEGLSFFRFLAERFGEEKVGVLLESLYRGYGLGDVFEAAFGVELEELNRMWEFDLRRRILSQFPDQQDIREYATEVDEEGVFDGPPRADGGRLLFSAFRNGRAELRVYRDGEWSGLARDRLPGFESLHLGDPAIDVLGDRAAFVTLSKGRDEVVIVSLPEGRIVERRRFDSILTIESLALSPDGGEVVIAALGEEGGSDLYRFRVGEEGIERITKDIYHETDLDWGEGGILFAADREVLGRYDLHRIPPGGAPELLLRLDRSATAPRWLGGRVLFLTRAENRPKNVHLFDPAAWTIRPVTRDAVGISGFDVDGDTLFVRANRSLRFSIWKTSLTGLLEPPAPETAAAPPGEVTEWTLPEPVAYEKKPYSRRYGPDLFFISGSAFYNQSLLGLSDILGDRKIAIFIGSNADRTSDILKFLSGGVTVHELGGRVDWRYGAFRYADEYLTDERGFFFRKETGVIGGVTYPFDRFRSVGLNLLLKHVGEEGIGGSSERKSGEVTVQGVIGYDTAVPGRFGYGFGDGLLASLIFSTDIEFTPERDVRNSTALADFRIYRPLGAGFQWAQRLSGGISVGDFPQQILIGGSLTLRGYDFLSLRGDRYALANEEVRFPLPLRLLAGNMALISRLQGAVFVDVGDAWFHEFDPVFRGSAGFGLRTGFGGAVFRWDLAKKFLRRDFAEGWESDFFLGYNF
ncbi:MAG: BamA/TamA family outer membrane protein [Candidatus Eisenbacteria bacterium]